MYHYCSTQSLLWFSVGCQFPQPHLMCVAGTRTIVLCITVSFVSLLLTLTQKLSVYALSSSTILCSALCVVWCNVQRYDWCMVKITGFRKSSVLTPSCRLRCIYIYMYSCEDSSMIEKAEHGATSRDAFLFSDVCDVGLPRGNDYRNFISCDESC